MTENLRFSRVSCKISKFWQISLVIQETRRRITNQVLSFYAYELRTENVRTSGEVKYMECVEQKKQRGNTDIRDKVKKAGFPRFEMKICRLGKF